jgi:tetratricopeptide (TPR) repeat protein
MIVQSERPSGHRARIASKVLALVSLLGAKYVTCQPGELDCEHAVLESDASVGVLVCRQEYTRTGDPATGARLANSLRRSRNFSDASAIANNLLATPARSDALQVLGKIAVSEHRIEAGRAALEAARELHVAERRPREIAADDQALAGVFRNQKRFAEALRALDSCITESQGAGDRVLEGYCHMSAGKVLGEVGYFSGAAEELDRAEPLLVLDRDLADLAIEHGTLDLRNGFGPLRLSHAEQAANEFKRAIRHASAAALTQVEQRAELNLVYALAERGRTDEATLHLEAARRLDLEGFDVAERTLLQARIAFRRGDFALATEINTRIYGKLSDDDDRLRVCVMQAEIGLATGVLEDTILWAARGVEVVEATRRAQSAIELRPWMLSVRRQPHELLFTALARAHRFDDAVLAFDRWQGRTLLDALARGAAMQPTTLRTAAMHTEALRHLVPALTEAPIMQVADLDVLFQGLRAVDLIAVLVANDEVWRITARHGRLDVADLGRVDALRPAVEQFRVTPTAAGLGDALGVKLLGDETFRDTDEALFVLLDGEIAGLPVAALRARGRPLVAMRPLVRAARLSELACVPAVSRPRRGVVIADARGNLPDARREAGELAESYGFRPVIGAAATRDALFAVAHDDLLHVAVHASVGVSGGSLELYDQPVSALEISGRRGGPALVMLSACASAVAGDDDGELATSLATAFLASGSLQVIGTLRPVTDAGAAEVARAFYRDHGAADPARTLARIQAALARTGNTDWPNFVLYGHDTCRKEPP